MHSLNRKFTTLVSDPILVSPGSTLIARVQNPTCVRFNSSAMHPSSWTSICFSLNLVLSIHSLRKTRKSV